MNLTRNQLKELIRQSIKEIDFKNQAAFDAYNKKHKMRKTTKVNVAGKETTAGDAEKKGTKGKKKEPMVRNAAGDMVPANTVAGHPDFKKDDKPDPGERDDSVRKDQKGGFNDTQDFLTGKNAESNIEKLNNLAMDDKPVQFDTDSGQSLTWDDGDYETDVVYAIDQDGGEVVVPFDDIVRLNMDIPRADRSNAALFSDPEKPKDEPEDDDVGGPSYANVPKGAKSSEHAKLMKKNDALADEYGYSDSNDLIDGAHSEEMEEFIDEIGADVDWGVVQSYLDDIRDYEQGMTDDDFKSEHAREKIQKIVNKAVESKPPKKEKSGKEIGKEMDKAVDDANAKLDKAELDQAYEEWQKIKQKYLDFDYHPIRDKDKPEKKKKRDELLKKNKDYYNNVVKPLEKKVYPKNESVYRFRGKLITESSRPKRSTVKEIAKWIKGLEENRYKKVSGADSRRVAWFVNNNLAEDFEQMPKSIVKKWSKAQYGRERYLAREFMKYRKREQKLRESIRRIIKGLV